MNDLLGAVAVDRALLSAEFADRLRLAGVPVPVQRIGWWAAAMGAAAPTRTDELYWLARVTLVDRAEHLEIFDAVFSRVFRGLVDVAEGQAVQVGDEDPTLGMTPDADGAPGGPETGEPDDGAADASVDGPGATAAGVADSAADTETGEQPVLALASEAELLRDKDFADCDTEELAQLLAIVDRMRVVVPTRPSRWEPARGAGRSIDLRRTLRAASRTGGDPVRWRHRRRGITPRPLVLLADVSGSMQAYSRIYLRVLQGAVIGARAHAYVFATRLHPVTRALGRGRREDAIGRALALSPDAAGGTRIGAAVKDFLDTDGRRGLARGAVVVIVSDGWERADPTLLAEQMRRLARLAYRVIWVNPRKAAPGFAPLAGGMAAALPHVDAFVAGHSARSVQDLLDAIAGTPEGSVRWPFP